VEGASHQETHDIKGNKKRRMNKERWFNTLWSLERLLQREDEMNITKVKKQHF
jgi:hypothetical protein